MNSNSKTNIMIYITIEGFYRYIYNILYLIYFSLPMRVKSFVCFATRCICSTMEREDRWTYMRTRYLPSDVGRSQCIHVSICTRSIEHSRELTNCGDHCETWFRFAALVYSVTTVADRPLFLIHLFRMQIYVIMYIFDSLKKKN